MVLVDYCSFPLDFYYLELKRNQVPLKQKNKPLRVETKNEQQDSNPIFMLFFISNKFKLPSGAFKIQNSERNLWHQKWCLQKIIFDVRTKFKVVSTHWPIFLMYEVNRKF